MRRNDAPRAPFTSLVLALTTIAALCAASRSEAATGTPAAPKPPAAATSASRPYTSAKVCRSCHQTIYTYWSESAHAQSASKPSYVDSLGAATGTSSDKDAIRRGCAWCHAPTTLVTGDYEGKLPITKEGVTCDFCHTIVDVEMDRPSHPFELRPGKVKRGPLLYAKTPFHETEYSALHRSSPLLCAGCHEYRNANGVAVLSTYSEWVDGPYPARGMPCQECHMPLVPGTTVPEGLKPTQRVINLHRVMGGSGAAKIKTGLDVRIDSVARTGASADVQVVVTNSGVGHAAPGGLSSKTLALVVGVESATRELMHQRERIYRRDLKDAEGRSLTTAADLFLRAASVGEDTRLKPKQSRTERFTVPIPQGAKAIVARLEYRDASEPGVPKTTLVTEERRELTTR